LCRGTGKCAAPLRKLEERHIECIRLLRCHLEDYPINSLNNSCEKNLEIMACITILIALEVSTMISESLCYH
jgi:hypothetical protein